MKLISKIRNSFYGFKNSRPSLYKWLLIGLSVFLFLGILPYDKTALVFFSSEKIATIITYVLYGFTAAISVILLFLVKIDRKKIIMLFGLIIVFALVFFGWAVGSLMNETFGMSRILSLGCFFIYYLFVIFAFDNKEDFILSLSITSLFLIVYSLLLYITKSEHVLYYAGYGKYYFKGIASNRNSFIELSLFPFIGFTYLAFKSKKIIYIVLFGVLAAICFGSTILTLSATAIIIMTLALILIVFKKWSYYVTNIYIIICFSSLIFVLAYFSQSLHFLDWFFKLLQKSTTLTGRTELWKTTFEVLKPDLVFGKGFDTTILADKGYPQNDPHNGFLYVLLTQGIFGLVIVIFLLFVATRKDKDNNLLYVFLAIFVSSWCYRSVVESGFSYTHFAFWSSVIVLIDIRLDTEKKFPPVPEILRKNKELVEDKQSIKKASGSTLMLYLLTFAKMVFPLITLPYLTRVLSTDTYGTVSYVKALMSYVQIVVDFGFIYSAVKDIVKINENKQEVNKTISNTIFAKLLLSLLSLIVVIILCLTIPILKNAFLFTILSLLTPILSIFLYDFLFRGIEKMHFTTITFVVTKLLSTLLVFVFVKSDSDIILIPIFDAIGTIVSIVIATFALLKNGYRFAKPSFRKALDSIKESFPYFINIVASTAFGILLTLIIGIAIPDATEISYWAVCMQLVAAVQSLYTPLSNGIYPYMIRKKKLNLLTTILLIFMPMVILGSLFCYFYAPFIIGLVSGESYVEGAYVFKALAPVLVLSFPVAILGWPALGPINKTKEITISTIVGAIVQILIVCILLIAHQFTLLNVAISRSVSEFSMLAVRVFYVIKYRKEFDGGKPSTSENMKAGIITHYNVHNHGAQLQLYALTQALKEEGFDTYALQFNKNYDFYDKDAQKKYSISLRSIPYYAKYAFSKGFGRTFYNISKKKKLNNFRVRNNLIGPFYTKADDLDVVVIGSDEIFSIEAGPNPWFYGIGVPCKHQISYAASFGPTTIETIDAHNMRGFVECGLHNLSKISVRDENSKEIVKQLTGIKPVLVCDPVILYDYRKIVSEQDILDFKQELTNKYCIVYSYDNNMNDKETIKSIKAFAKKNKLVIVSVGYYHKWCNFNVNLDPIDVYKWFECAECVFTDTFHGTVLSLVTNTEFFTKINGNQNKLEFLLKQFDSLDRKVDSFTNLEELTKNKVDFEKINKKIASLRKTSTKYLKDALNTKK